MSICPKNKSSKARRDSRRANWKMSAMNLVKCSKCGALMMPHRVCKAWFSPGGFFRLQQEARYRGIWFFAFEAFRCSCIFIS